MKGIYLDSEKLYAKLSGPIKRLWERISWVRWIMRSTPRYVEAAKPERTVYHLLHK